METYPWWTEEHKEFAKKIRAFVEEVMPRDEETRWTREFPQDVFKKIGEEELIGKNIQITN